MFRVLIYTAIAWKNIAGLPGPILSALTKTDGLPQSTCFFLGHVDSIYVLWQLYMICMQQWRK